MHRPSLENLVQPGQEIRRKRHRKNWMLQSFLRRLEISFPKLCSIWIKAVSLSVVVFYAFALLTVDSLRRKSYKKRWRAIFEDSSTDSDKNRNTNFSLTPGK